MNFLFKKNGLQLLGHMVRNILYNVVVLMISLYDYITLCDYTFEAFFVYKRTVPIETVIVLIQIQIG